MVKNPRPWGVGLSGLGPFAAAVGAVGGCVLSLAVLGLLPRRFAAWLGEVDFGPPSRAVPLWFLVVIGCSALGGLLGSAALRVAKRKLSR